MTMRRRLAWVGSSAAALWVLTGTVAAAAQIRTPPADSPDPRIGEVAFRIDAQPIDGALRQFASQANLQLIYETTEVSPEIRSPHVSGALTPEAALDRLLAETNLGYKFINNRTVSIRSAGSTPESRGDPGGESATRNAQTRLAAAPAQPAPEAADASAVSASTSDDGKRGRPQSDVAEVLVTAQKRSEKLMDVPAALSSISGDRLESLQVNTLSDLAGYVPGLSTTTGGSPGYRTIVIRGLADSYNDSTTAPLVATYIDDLPVGASSNSARANIMGADLVPYDVERIEVLKGPQGTLYGADSMAGLVKYVLRKPNLQEFEARFGSDLEDVRASSGAGWNARGAISFPIAPGVLAARFSAVHQDTPGYIDNIGTGIRKANKSTENGGRAALRWQATDDLSIEANALAQNIDADDSTAVTIDATTLRPVYGTNKQSTFLPQPFKQRARNYTLNADWNLGFGTLTSAAGWSEIKSELGEDFSALLGQYTPDHPDALAVYQIRPHVSKFVEETRLSSSTGTRIEWMAGALYTRESTGEDASFPTFTPDKVPLPIEDNLLIESVTGVYKEWAVFGNATYKLTDRFDVSGGARYAQNKETDCRPLSTGVFGSGELPCTSRPFLGVTTWMANARFHFNRDTMLYARVATGYRPGGGCPTCGNPNLGIPGEFFPDKTTNYESGFKGELLNRRLVLDLSVFHIAWRNIQLQQQTADNLVYTGNGGTASSSGFEFATTFLPTAYLHFTATAAYTDAHLTEDAPAVGGFNGDQLPISPRWTASLTTDYVHPISDRVSLLSGGGYRYRDAVLSQFAHTDVALGGSAPVRPQSIVDLYSGFVTKRLTTRIYARNVFNNRAYSGVFYISDPQRPLYVPIQPRTLGVSMDYQF